MALATKNKEWVNSLNISLRKLITPKIKIFSGDIHVGSLKLIAEYTKEKESLEGTNYNLHLFATVASNDLT